MLFFKAEVSSSSNFASFFSVITHISSILFWLKHNILSTKVINQSANFQTCHFLHQNSPNSSSYFWNKQSAFLQTLLPSSVSSDVTLFCTFSFKTLYALDRRSLLKCKFSGFNQIPYIIFQATSELCFQFCIFFQCHDK